MKKIALAYTGGGIMTNTLISPLKQFSNYVIETKNSYPLVAVFTILNFLDLILLILAIQIFRLF